MNKLPASLWTSVVICTALCGPVGVRAQALREDQALFTKPDGQQAGVKLKSGTQVKPLRRQGFWVEVETNGAVGWLKVSMLNFGTPGNGPAAIDTGRLGVGNIVSTSAARGLSAKDLINGKPNFEELLKLEQFGATNSETMAFLADGNLTSINQKISLSPVGPGANAPATVPKSNSPRASGTSIEKSQDDW